MERPDGETANAGRANKQQETEPCLVGIEANLGKECPTDDAVMAASVISAISNAQDGNSQRIRALRRFGCTAVHVPSFSHLAF